MNDKITVSTFQMFERFPNAEAAQKYLEARLWPRGAVCPKCRKSDRLTARSGKGKEGFYRCNACKEDFTVRTGTIFERSHVPLHKWLYAMYLLVTARKGISSMQLAKEIGITQKSAWFVLHRLREACGKDLAKLRGSVEIDETFVGGLESNKHEGDKLKQGRGSGGKIPVLGMRERGGRTKAMPLKSVSIEEVQNAIHRNIEVGSTLFTDEHGAYNDLDGLFFKQERVIPFCGRIRARDGYHKQHRECLGSPETRIARCLPSSQQKASRSLRQ